MPLRCPSFAYLGAVGLLLATPTACRGGGSGGEGDGSSGTTNTSSATGTGSEGEPTSADAADDTTTDGPPDADVCAVGQSVFDETVVHTIDLQLTDADWTAMIQEAEQSPEYGGPDKTYFNADFLFDGAPLDAQVAVRLKGHSSLLGAVEQGHSFPLKVDFNRVDADQDLDGITKVNLHTNLDGITVANEYLSYGAIREHGVPTARVGFARVTVNGEDLGLYSLVEHIKGKFVRCHYDEPRGDLYKPEEPVGNLAWLGPEISDYEPEIQFKWPDVSTTDHASLLNLLDVVNHQTIAEFDGVLDVTGVLTYLAMNVGMGNYDYYASFGHNYYFYESTPGRFTMVPWDMNFSQTLLDHPCGFGRNDAQWPVSNTLLGDPATVDQYLGLLQGFLQGAGSPQSLHARLDTLVALLGDDLDADALTELRQSIDLRVQLQLAAIEQGIDVCPEFVEDGGERSPCDMCIDRTCEAQLDACIGDPDCACMIGCFDEDKERPACLMQCGLTRPPATLDAVFECIDTGCADACR